MKINPNAGGYRFHSNVKSRRLYAVDQRLGWVDRLRVFIGLKKRNDRSSSIFNNPKRICSTCNKPYDSIVQSGIGEDGIKWCRHDQESKSDYDPTRLTTAEQRRISDRLKPNEVAIKHYDGTIAILERTK